MICLIATIVELLIFLTFDHYQNSRVNLLPHATLSKPRVCAWPQEARYGWQWQ
jgi:hypothetical protein